MATKPLQLDDEGKIMNDAQTQKNQKDYAEYEKDLSDAQKKRNEEGPLDHWTRKLKRTFLGIDDSKKPVKKAKGGKVGSASKRGDGIAQRGKTKGRMV